MIHRHLAVAKGTAPELLGPAALDDLLDRGDLEDWRPLARAVKADPHGRLASTILHLCRSHHMYGTSALWIAWIERLRGETGETAPEAVGLAGLRAKRGLTQTQLAQRLGISQSDVSKLERRGDMRLSTLRAAVEALGGSLEISARFEGLPNSIPLKIPPG